MAEQGDDAGVSGGNQDTDAALARESIDALSRIALALLRVAMHAQAVAIRVVDERFGKDIETMAKFARCNDLQEILELQEKLCSELMSDHLALRAKVLALFSDVANAARDELARVAGARRRG